MRVPFRLVDVFADRPLAGNQLCVVPEPVGLPTETMQALAREIGFSETTFVTEASGDRFAMRIFLPGAEIPFAGHPTLGTAFVLVAENRVSSPATQLVEAGEFRVEVDVEGHTARMWQHAPEFGTGEVDRGVAARAAGLEPNDLHPDLQPQVVSTGLRHLLVPARDEATVARARSDEAAVGTLLAKVGADGFYLFASDGRRAKARLFTADLGVSEDPATGSAAGPLGAYLAEHGVISSTKLTISQGVEIGRPSALHVEVERDGDSWRVAVSGGVFVVGEGWFELDLPA